MRATKPTTTVHSNGAGTDIHSAQPLETLFELFKTNTLDPMWEDYGDFNEKDPRDPPGWRHIAGNFWDLSHVFRIHTNDAALIKRFKKAVEENKARPEYAEAKRKRAENLEYWRQHEIKTNEALRGTLPGHLQGHRQ